MNPTPKPNPQSLVARSLAERGVTRREFLKFCTILAGALALPARYGVKIAEALEARTERLPVIWLEFQDCAGCSESFTRAYRTSAAQVVLDLISLNYHETLMTAAGTHAEQAREETIQKGGYVVVVEGAVPSAAFCTIGGKSAEQILLETTKNAAAVIAVGSCGSFGGLPKAHPNPTGARAVMEIVKDKPVLNLPGCPVNGENITATIAHFLTFGELPAMDDLHRPLFAYGALIHDNCPRRAHFDRGEFVREWGDEGHKKGWCLYKMGCKGPVTHANCPLILWNDGTSWPIGSGHPCLGCTEPDFWDLGIYNQAKIQEVAPPAYYPEALATSERPIDGTSYAVTGAVVGAALGALGALAVAKGSATTESEGEPPPSEET